MLTTVVDDQGDPPRLLNMLFQSATQELKARHPDIDIRLDYRPIPYLNLHTQFLKTMANQTPVDIMSVDQIWLGEFVEKGYLTDLTDRAKSWGRERDWYEANWDGGVYGYMPTQIPIGEGPYSAQLKQTVPYSDKLISMMTIALARPSIPEYPHIAEDIHQALDQVFYKAKEPKQALDDAASKSAKSMGW